MANICPHTKFDENMFVVDRDMAKNPKFKVAAAAVLNFIKNGILGQQESLTVRRTVELWIFSFLLCELC